MKRRSLWLFAVVGAFWACKPDLAIRPVLLIPEPLELAVTDGAYKLYPGATISYSNDSLRDVAEYLVGTIEKMNGLQLKLSSQGEGDIELFLDTSIVGNESYRLVSDVDGIRLSANSSKGLVLGVASLQQLISPNASQGAAVAYVKIEDAPRFAYRGLHLDVSRHFFTSDQVKDLLDLMARYKLNVFHWHLTDDQGWRIEVKQYPLLTEKGAWRKFNNQDRECMANERKYDEPAFQIPQDRLKVEGGDTLYGGFYTQQEIRDVVAYAAHRGIDVLPEVDMPGHLMGAILGYPVLSCKGEAGWGSTFSDPLCVGSDSALQMAKNIYTEIATLFPYEYMHLGADEVEKTNWKACSKCQARIRNKGLKNEEELQSWFVHEMETHINSLGKKLMGWDEIVEGGLSPTATMMWWRDWAPDAVSIATGQGNDVVMSPCFSMYFDAWEDVTPLKKSFDFEPVPASLSTEQAKHIIGVQGNLWSETVPSVERMQQQYFPRIFALAETAWSNREAKDWDHFQLKVVHEVEFLDAKGIQYRIPALTGFHDVNVFTDSIQVKVHCPWPGVQIRYTLDGSLPTLQSLLYTGSFSLNESAKICFRGFRPDGTSGEVYRADYRKEGYAPAVSQSTPGKTGVEVKQYGYKGVYHKKQCGLVDQAPLQKQFVLEKIDLSSEIKGFMGLVAKGQFFVPTDTIHTFALNANDGATLQIDGAMLIDNDGTHGDKEMVAQKALGKGWHAIEVRYFDLNNGGKLQLSMDGKLMSGFMH